MRACTMTSHGIKIDFHIINTGRNFTDEYHWGSLTEPQIHGTALHEIYVCMYVWYGRHIPYSNLANCGNFRVGLFHVHVCIHVCMCSIQRRGPHSGVVDLYFSMYNVPGTSGSVLIKRESDVFVSGVVLYTSSWDLDV